MQLTRVFSDYSSYVVKSLFLTFVVISPLVINSYLPIRSAPKIDSKIIAPVDSQKITENKFVSPKSQAKLVVATATPTPVEPTPVEKKVVNNTVKLPTPSVLGEKDTSEDFEVSDNSGSYVIAVLGDSMIDVMQPDLPQLVGALDKYYPEAEFKLLNYGVGASDMEYALTRLTSDYTYLDRDVPALLSTNPDIVVIESFAYNHWGNNQGDLDRQWLTLAEIIDALKSRGVYKIVLAATIGPDQKTLCDGIEGINLSADQKWEKAITIRAYLQNLINYATSQDYPLADAYHASLDETGNGKSEYVNQGDHLHPSGPGGELLAAKIAEAIFENGLLD